MASHHRPWTAYIGSNDVGHGMPSSPLDSIHGRTTSSMACYHHLRTAHIVRQHQAWNAITALGQHTRTNYIGRIAITALGHHKRLDYIGRGMLSSPLDSTHDRITSNVACPHGPWAPHMVARRRAGQCYLFPWHNRMISCVAWPYRPWATHTVARCRVWHAITTLGQHTQLDDIGRDMSSSPLGITQSHTMSTWHARWPLGSTHGRMTLDLACYHRFWTANKAGRHWAWHDIIALGLHTRTLGRTTYSVAFLHGPWQTHLSDNVVHDKPSSPLDSTHAYTGSNEVERGMPLSPLENIHCQTTSGVTWHHCLWEAHTVGESQHTRSEDIGCGMPLLPLDSIHGRTMSGLACHHRCYAAHTVGRCREWHDIITLGKHTRSNKVCRGMEFSPMDSTHGRTKSSGKSHHCPWIEHTVRRCWAWHAIFALVQHTRLDDVGRGMLSLQMESIHNRRRWAWHLIITFGLHARSNHIGRGMPTLPLNYVKHCTPSSRLGNTLGWMTLGVTYQHCPWEAYTVGRR
ncbi:hypothetical protein EJD97_002798 [Solanum chilense]|uniref:Uncharacterized protein n=1 Tax=Solanum chilense TaxID=4083 RepID=A0A6N2ATG2_SOLCI|nr:hypothetical protein EJD97_002798 [Solanum chilense]